MKLQDILTKNSVFGELKSTDKKGILQELADKVVEAYPALDGPKVLQVLLERERLGSTGVGNGVAIPHGKISSLDSIIACFGRSKTGIDFQSHDHKPAVLFFVLLAPEKVIGNHLQALARLSRLLKSESVRNHLIEVSSAELYDVLMQEDEKL